MFLLFLFCLSFNNSKDGILYSNLDKKNIENWILGKDEEGKWKVIGEKKEEKKMFIDSFKPKENPFILYDFNSIYNSLGGIYGKYMGREARLEVYQRKNFLILVGEKLDMGWAGIWISFFPIDDVYIKPLDLRDYEALIIQYKIEKGKNVRIKIADKERYLREKPLEIFSLKEEKIGEWKSLKINLKNFPLDLSNLCSLVLDLTGNSEIELKIGNIYALKENNFLPYPKEYGLKEVKKERAIYFWDTIEMLSNKEDWKKLTKILKKGDISTIFIQIPYIINKEEDCLWLKKRGKKFKNFLNLLISEEINFQFLDGWKGFALKENHNRLLKQIQRLYFFWNTYFPNKNLPPLHLDIEPYLLKEYNSKNYKPIYFQFIELLKKIKDNYPDIILYLDIPFWLDNLKGGEKIIGDILNFSHGVYIMAYRSKVWSKNGIIEVSNKEIEISKKKEKKVFISLETMELKDEIYYGVFKNDGSNFPLYLKETEIPNIYLISKDPSEYGLKIIEQVEGSKISLFGLNWKEILNYEKEILNYYPEINGISYHHLGSLKDLINK